MCSCSLLPSNDAWDMNGLMLLNEVPLLWQEIETSIADLADESFLLRTQCEKCGQDFLIVEGVPMTEERYSLHNPPRP